ncbi:MAG: TraR/DksA C4-type zinc finger protein [Planctomycetes bacterium]|nr:TraR/DksA C4-type zinc finger protein [Planctomycetota bacterium]
MTKRITRKDEAELKRTLQLLHGRLLDDLTELEEDAVGSADHPVDTKSNEGTLEAAQEAELEMLEEDERLLHEVVAALRRLEAGTYGACEDCDEPIGRERLHELPYARRCVACETTFEHAPPLADEEPA